MCKFPLGSYPGQMAGFLSVCVKRGPFALVNRYFYQIGGLRRSFVGAKVPPVDGGIHNIYLVHDALVNLCCGYSQVHFLISVELVLNEIIKLLPQSMAHFSCCS